MNFFGAWTISVAAMPVTITTTEEPDDDQRPHASHNIAMLVAMAVSLVAHVALWIQFPGLPIPPTRPNLEKQYKAIHLEDVRLAPPPRNSDTAPDRTRLDKPDQLADLLGAPAPMPELAVDSLKMPEPQEIKSPLDTTAPAQGGPVTSPDRSRWEPRQEIIQIEKRVVRDEVAMLPRQLTPEVIRVARAPDVILPIELPMSGDGFVSTSRDPSLKGGYSLTSPNGVEGGTGSGTANRGGPSSRDRLFPGTTDLFDERPRDVTTTKGVEQYLDLTMFLYRPPEENGAGYFELQIRRHGEQTLPVLPKDVLFIQDSSGSMTPAQLIECKAGLRRWLEALGPKDRFEIISFRDTVSRCFGSFTTLNPDTRTRALAFIDGMRAVGDTDVYASLEAARQMRQSDDRPVIAVLVTDGRPTTGLTRSTDIIEGFTRANKGGVPIFALGAGRKCNRFLIDLLSYRNRGESSYTPEQADIPQALARQATELSRPVLHDLTYRMTGFDASQIYPQSLTPMFLDRPFVLYGRIAPGQTTAAIQIAGRAGAQPLDMVFTLDAAKAQPGTPAIRERWAWQKVYGLIGGYIQTQDQQQFTAIQNHARAYRLNVPYGFSDNLPVD